jgi:molecular chaperone HtpG
MGAESHEFQAEARQLLDLMIHSLYSHKEVFLRELISNASDAIDKRRFLGLTDAALQSDDEPSIQLVADREARTLSISDNGIGMSREETVQNLGTIAKSGSGEFLSELKAGGGKDASPDLIGQFGVGFYAAFMVAEKVSVVTRRAGEDAATHWESDGAGSYTLEEGERDAPGTTITLQLREVDSEAGISDYSDEWVLRQVVKKYSDFVSYPLRLEVEGKEESEEGAAPGDEPLNSMKAIWTRPEDEVTEEEHKEFYKHISHDWKDPLLHLAASIEGTFEARALLYIPSVAPFDLYHRDMAHRGIQLYVKRIFVMDECSELMPEYLRFVKGVVDAEDISLNVSREMLQQDRQIQAIRKHLVKKTMESLAELKQEDEEQYLGFWAQFGAVLKEGLLHYEDKRERILDIMLCASTESETKLSSLADYVSRAGDDQDVIYYLTGSSREVLASSPHLEAFREKGLEVLFFTDPVDEVWLEQGPPEFEGKKWQSIGKGEVELGSDEEKKQAEEEHEAQEASFKSLIACLRAGVQDEVKEVRLSKRLTTSPACLVLEEGDITPQIAAMLKQAGQEVPDVKPILELNPGHPLLEKLQGIFDKNGTDPRLSEYAKLLLGQAVLAEGGQLADPADFSRRLAELMVEALPAE